MPGICKGPVPPEFLNEELVFPRSPQHARLTEETVAGSTRNETLDDSLESVNIYPVEQVDSRCHAAVMAALFCLAGLIARMQFVMTANSPLAT